MECFLFFQLEEKYLIEIFCEVDMDAFEEGVGELFTNLAFEAVERITDVSFSNSFPFDGTSRRRVSLRLVKF